jgi:hypothetical protein
VHETHVPRAELKIAVEHLEVRPQRVSVLYADRGDQLPARCDACNVACGICDLDALRIELLGHAVNRGEFRLGIGLRARVTFGRAGRLADEHDEEAGVEAAGCHLRQVDL